MRVTVCELPNGWTESPRIWEELSAHLRSEASDFLLLPEMPFCRWLAGDPQADEGRWRAAVRAHDRWIDRLDRLPVAVVAGTRPVVRAGRRFNEGFVWTGPRGVRGLHDKRYLPNEAGFWEANWYERGGGDFSLAEIQGNRIGFLICTELWFQAHARQYARGGIHLLLCPRATPLSSVDKWIAGGRAAAVVSGAFCLSSNLAGPNTAGIDFGGAGWIVAPEEGDLLGRTRADQPFVTREIDLREAERAKKTYPRYVGE